tara:strand:- start:307 stop:1758 length:1452 start_codon:yes stop_codon:yes gene_type:complete
MNWNPSWANAIASIESQGSGGYSAVGPTTQKGNRAYGKYQVMDFNIPTWTEKHLGQRLTPDQFLSSPEAQEAVFKGEFGSYVSKYGNPQDAASAWFTGRPQSEGSNRSDALGTTGSGYVSKFNNALGTGATLTGGQPMMQPEQKPKGLLGGLFSNPDKRARLAMALEGMTLNPNRGMMASLQGGIEQRGLDKKESAAEAKQLAQRNKSLEFLALQEGGEDYVRLAKAAGVPTAIKAYLESRKAPKSTTAQDKIARLKSTGVPENIAIGITDGRLVVRTDEVTGETFVFDAVTNERVSKAPSASPETVETTVRPSVFEDTNVKGATGASGFGANLLNSVVDAFGGGQPANKIAEANSALQTLSTTTMLGLASEFPGRPSNLTREEIRKLTIFPGEISQGPAKALNKAKNMILTIEQSLNTAKQVVSGRYSPGDKAAAQNSINMLEPLLSDYKSLATELKPEEKPGVFKVTPGQTSILDLYAPRN